VVGAGAGRDALAGRPRAVPVAPLADAEVVEDVLSRGHRSAAQLHPGVDLSVPGEHRDQGGHGDGEYHDRHESLDDGKTLPHSTTTPPPTKISSVRERPRSS